MDFWDFLCCPQQKKTNKKKPNIQNFKVLKGGKNRKILHFLFLDDQKLDVCLGSNFINPLILKNQNISIILLNGQFCMSFLVKLLVVSFLVVKFLHFHPKMLSKVTIRKKRNIHWQDTVFFASLIEQLSLFCLSPDRDFSVKLSWCGLIKKNLHFRLFSVRKILLFKLF